MTKTAGVRKSQSSRHKSKCSHEYRSERFHNRPDKAALAGRGHTL